MLGGMLNCGWIVLFFLSFCISFSLRADELQPKHVAVVYNAKSPLSKQVAQEYMRVRSIPEKNLIKLDCPIANEITRAQYDELIKLPLLREGIENRWWGNALSIGSGADRRIYAIVMMPDLPMKIKHELPVPPQGKPINQITTDRASVDSELSMLGVTSYELKGAVKNPYYNADESITDTVHSLFLVCRIDALTKETCLRMTKEPSEVEQRGLWGWAVVDRGGPYKQGDKWLDSAFDTFIKAGLPVYKDDWSKPLPKLFPLSNDTALYCGWYTTNAYGPFADPEFRFRPGAVAMHLHSYSASNFKTAGQGWSNALLERGAVATVGNVYEPFLTMTHRFDIFMDRLLKGYSLAESAWMSMPVTSWQGVVFGDPLYRPFAKMKSLDVKATPADRYFQGWWAGVIQFGDDWAQRSDRMLTAAGKANIPFLYEALGLEYLYRKEYDKAVEVLKKAFDLAKDDRTKSRIRLEFLLVERARGGKNAFVPAADKLKAAMASSRFLPALDEWYVRMVPPPPKPNPNQSAKPDAKAAAKPAKK